MSAPLLGTSCKANHHKNKKVPYAYGLVTPNGLAYSAAYSYDLPEWKAKQNPNDSRVDYPGCGLTSVVSINGATIKDYTNEWIKWNRFDEEVEMNGDVAADFIYERAGGFFECALPSRTNRSRVSRNMPLQLNDLFPSLARR